MKQIKSFWKNVDKRLVLHFIIWLLLVFLIPSIFNFFLTSNIGYNFFSFNSFLAMAILVFIIYNRKYLMNFKLKLNTSISLLFGVMALFSLLAFIYTKYFIAGETNDIIITYTHVSLVLQAMFVIFSALALFGMRIFREHFETLLYILTAVYVYFLLTLTAWANWRFFSTNITKVVTFILNLFFDDVSYFVGKDIDLYLNNFQVTIGPPCSGIESLVFFITLFGLMLVLDRDRLNFKKAAVVFGIGIIGTYFMNAVRLSALMIIGLRYPDFAMGQFHSQSGWVMFALFVLVLYGISQKWILKPEFRKKLKKKK